LKKKSVYRKEEGGRERKVVITTFVLLSISCPRKEKEDVIFLTFKKKGAQGRKKKIGDVTLFLRLATRKRDRGHNEGFSERKRGEEKKGRKVSSTTCVMSRRPFCASPASPKKEEREKKGG